MLKISINCIKDILKFIDKQNKSEVFSIEERVFCENEKLLEKYSWDLIYYCLEYCVHDKLITSHIENDRIIVYRLTKRGYDFYDIATDHTLNCIKGGIERFNGFTLESLIIIRDTLKS